MAPGDWLELVVIGLTIAFSPAHLGLLFWLILGPDPQLRSSLLVLSWVTISGLMIALLAVVILGPQQPGWTLPGVWPSVSAPLLDILTAIALITGALIAMAGLGVHGGGDPGKDQSAPKGPLQKLFKLPFPLILALSCGWQILSPEDGLLTIRALNRLGETGMAIDQLMAPLTVLWLISGCLMILPLLLLIVLGSVQIKRVIEPLKTWLNNHAAIALGSVSLLLAAYLACQSWASWPKSDSGISQIGWNNDSINIQEDLQKAKLNYKRLTS